MLRFLAPFAVRRLCQGIALFFIALNSHAALASPSFAFFYGADVPWETLGGFDVVVVEPGNVPALATGPGWSQRLNPATTVAAYIAVGEVHPTRSYFKAMRPEWKLGENKDWGSIVADQAAPGWAEFYVAQVVKPLWDSGYKAFFLDTLDSFYLVAKTKEAQQKQIAGMAALVQAIKRAYPDAKLIFNRGFEILPQVHSLAYAVAAESLFQGWDAGKQVYTEVNQADRDWLWGQLKKCRDDYQLSVIAIDYVPPENRALARETARKIRALGAVPWVTNPAINMVGVGQVEVLPRQVLAIHDEPGHVGKVSEHEIHRVGTLPLNALGLDARYVFHGSPELALAHMQPLAGRYAGVVVWFNRGSFPDNAAMASVMKAARAQGVPLVIVGAMPEEAVLAELGLESGKPERVSTALALEKRSPHVGYEIEPRPLVSALTPIALKQGEVWLRASAPSGRYADVIGIAPWGGYAVDRYWKIDLSQNQGERWAVNPIAFFKAALRLDPSIPVPDVTTENGRRLLMVHVDGDGFASRAEIPGTPLASEVMLTEFLQRYRLPSTVSVIEGETAKNGLYPALSPLLEATARKIFALPHVEIASHTYSHPFRWADIELDPEGGAGAPRPGYDPQNMSLRLPGYRFSTQREIAGSAAYINKELAPAGKRTRMLLWSGDTQPLPGPVQAATQAGLFNMNSGNTWISRSQPSLTLVGPIGLMKGDYFQTYAPNQNENVYTNDWKGPFYGFERVIETFEMTDAPLRLKPINIYYHTYIASKRASINSLHKVYQWAMAQSTFPLYASQYVERTQDWRRATVALTGSGDYELRAGGPNLRQWRVERPAGSEQARLDLSASQGLAGQVRHGGVQYLHAIISVANYRRATLAPGQSDVKTPLQPELESANARLITWALEAPGLWRAEFEGQLPLQARLRAPGCSLQSGSSAGLKASTPSPDILALEGTSLGRTQALLRCPG